ncbi:hypothetical protein EMIHUDRAFT_55103, partial [Emiliania huxleyi CCMP1516]|uniref:serine O-acetyltransferase n=2 Tax=Emiliania huxleyi TaxID=2903 RepID=A0A0D3KTT1_EMIH1
VFLSAFRAEPDLCTSVASDILRFKEVDPAARGGQGLLGVYLFYKGVHALACARVAGHYWRRRGEAGKLIARLLQSEGSDIAARHAQPRTAGITIDHATGVVIGETSVVGDNVYLMHDVTLGATGTGNAHDRHPKIGAGAFLGAKSTVLGNIHVGEGATIAASALVNKPVPPGYTAVGVPARLL